MKVIIALLVIWVVLAILGAVIKGLFWLLIIGVVLFLVTAVFGGIRQSRGRSSSS
ncbi:hypothetical protein [Naasia lichenicola]|uniref:hypothetical protein n=1 Tax=Naasia lichenicola TaxID=2565933 RepID=UPI0018EE60E5|nr:hypothetical protein [Naasia lichenicola]